MKVSKGSYVSSDATPIASARRPRKSYKSKQGEEQGKDQGQDAVVYSDDRDASWKKKGEVMQGLSQRMNKVWWKRCQRTRSGQRDEHLRRGGGKSESSEGNPSSLRPWG